MELTNAFAVPIGYDRLDPCDRLNGELETLLLDRETEDYRNPSPTHTPRTEMFESRFDLFTWPESCVQELRGFVLKSVTNAALAASSLTQADLARLTLYNHTWFHVTRDKGYFVAHNHALASWSAVYCVKNGSERSAGGLLRIFDPRTGADAFSDQANRRLCQPFVVGNLELDLRPGQLVIFPSYLFHEVTPYYGSEPRITVATNCWFTG